MANIRMLIELRTKSYLHPDNDNNCQTIHSRQTLKIGQLFAAGNGHTSPAFHHQRTNQAIASERFT